MKNFYPKIRQVNSFFQRAEGLSFILTRLTIAWVFAPSGWKKLQTLDQVILFFEKIGIPAASIQAPMVAVSELSCGMLILIGLGTRLASIPLLIIMVVAIYTAKWGELHGLGSITEMTDFLYILLLLWLLTHGAGRFSLDHLIAQEDPGPYPRPLPDSRTPVESSSSKD